jgi:hypothetical protein
MHGLIVVRIDSLLCGVDRVATTSSLCRAANGACDTPGKFFTFNDLSSHARL